MKNVAIPIDVLRSGNQAEIEKYGPQRLDAEEASQLSKDRADSQKYVDREKYRDDRAGEYPSLADQLDALWKGGEQEQQMRDKIMSVKEKYPKPEIDKNEL